MPCLYNCCEIQLSPNPDQSLPYNRFYRKISNGVNRQFIVGAIFRKISTTYIDCAQYKSW